MISSLSRLLEAHGIRMLPEEELNISQSLTLTEAGKLVLSSLNQPGPLASITPSVPSLPSSAPAVSTITVSLASPRSNPPDAAVVPSPRPVSLATPRAVSTANEVKMLTSLSSRNSNSPLNSLRCDFLRVRK